MANRSPLCYLPLASELLTILHLQTYSCLGWVREPKVQITLLWSSDVSCSGVVLWCRMYCEVYCVLWAVLHSTVLGFVVSTQLCCYLLDSGIHPTFLLHRNTGTDDQLPRDSAKNRSRVPDVKGELPDDMTVICIFSSSNNNNNLK